LNQTVSRFSVASLNINRNINVKKNTLGVVRTSDGKRYILQTWDFVLHLMGESEYLEFLENSKAVGQEVAFKKIYDENRVRALGYPTDSPGFYGQVNPDYRLK